MDSLFDAMVAPQQDDLVMQRAKQQFPILNGMDVGFKNNPGGGKGYLEFWPRDEIGTADAPRPREFPLGQIGVEVYDPTTRPIDIMGDVASHHLVHTDPVVGRTYRQFEESLTSEQQTRLRDQYQSAIKNEGEARPYEDWYQHSGLPAYFRGYAFQQWDKPEELYTPAQRRSFDHMMNYLRGQQER